MAESPRTFDFGHPDASTGWGGGRELTGNTRGIPMPPGPSVVVGASLALVTVTTRADPLGPTRRLLGARFKSIAEVEAMYMRPSGAVVEVVVLLSTTQYDDALMDRLLDIEYDLQGSQERFLMISYRPSLGRSRQDILGPGYETLLER